MACAFAVAVAVATLDIFVASVDIVAGSPTHHHPTLAVT